MGSLKEADVKKLQSLALEKGEKVLSNVSEDFWSDVFEGVSEDIKKARLFAQKAQEEKERLNKAKVAYSVIMEAKKVMGKLNPEYASLLKEVKELEEQCNNATEIVAGVTVGVVAKESPIRQNLENAKKGIAYIEKAVGDSIAEKYGFQSALQVKNLVQFGEKTN